MGVLSGFGQMMMRFSKFKLVFGFLLLAGISFLALGFFPLGPKTFPIQLKVDFGPAGKPHYEGKINVDRGTTPKEAVSQVFPVRSDKVCCSFRDVSEIGGVGIRPKENLWWICKVNGSRNVSPYRKKLKPGDVLEWQYVQERKCPIVKSKEPS